MFHRTLLASLCALLSACGGGGSSTAASGETPPPPPPVVPVVTTPVVVVTKPDANWRLERTFEVFSVQPAKTVAVTMHVPPCAGVLTVFADMVMRSTAQSAKAHDETYVALMLSLDGVAQDKDRSVSTLRLPKGQSVSETLYDFKRFSGSTPSMDLGIVVHKFTSMDYITVDIVEATVEATCVVSS